MRTSCDILLTSDGRRIHFAVMAIESAAVGFQDGNSADERRLCS